MKLETITYAKEERKKYKQQKYNICYFLNFKDFFFIILSLSSHLNLLLINWLRFGNCLHAKRTGAVANPS